VIRAFLDLPAAFRQRRPLVLVGMKGWLTSRIESSMRSMVDSGQVRPLGFTTDEDLAALYASAMVLVYPSLYEGFGLPPLEAMACGTPCVVSNSSSLPEVTGSAALLFNPTSLDDFENCMLRVLTQPELYERLRQDGLRQSALFPWSKAAGETLEVYRAVWDEVQASARRG
jgi:alpha-1,3-rhamnosyl/mannosyltransferase